MKEFDIEIMKEIQGLWNSFDPETLCLHILFQRCGTLIYT